jgi:hypothetical protein
MIAFHRRAAAMIVALWMVIPVPGQAQDGHETAFVIGLMESMNALSIRFNREVCGYILRHPDGTHYSTTKASWGGHASCASLAVEDGAAVVSSWHTHAAWVPEYDGEVPSVQDVEGDMQLGVNGWVGTPGGRLWFVDVDTGDIRQVCGLGCLPSDPNFIGDDDPVRKTYTLDALQQRFGDSR